MYYRKRITDICENLKFIKDYKDISDLIAVKRALSFGKLLQNHHAFKEDMVKLDIKIKERRQQLKDMNKSNRQQMRPKKVEPKPVGEEVKEAPPMVKVQSDTEGGTSKASNRGGDSEDDLESYDSN